MRTNVVLLWLLTTLAFTSSVFAQQPLTARERNARATLAIQSNSFEAALIRRLDDELAPVIKQREVAKSEAKTAKAALALAKGNAAKERRRAENAENRVGEIETEMLNLVAAKDAQFARERLVLYSLGDELMSTPEGLAVLEEYNKGGKTSYQEASKLLDKLMETRAKVRSEQAAEIRRLDVEDLQRRAAFDYDAMGKGYQTTEYVIAKYEKVVALASDSAADWRRLAELYRNANKLDKAADAARLAFENETDDRGKAQALIELGDAQTLVAYNRAGMANAASGIDAFANILQANPTLQKSKGDFGALEKEIGFDSTLAVVEAMIDAGSDAFDLVQVAPEISTARSTYQDALNILETMKGNREADLMSAETLTRLSALNSQMRDAYFAAEFKKILAEMKQLLADFQTVKNRQAEMTQEEFQAEGLKFASRWAAIDQRMEGPVPNSAFGDASLDQTYAAQKILFDMYNADKKDIEVRRALVRSFLTTAKNEPSRAYIYTGDAVSMMKELAVEQPDISLIKYELAMAHQMAGIAAMSAKLGNPGDNAKAGTEFQLALDQIEPLVESDPTTALYQRGLARILESIALLDNNFSAWQRVIRHYEAMQVSGLLAPADQYYLDIAHTYLKAAEKLPPGSKPL